MKLLLVGLLGLALSSSSLVAASSGIGHGRLARRGGSPLSTKHSALLHKRALQRQRRDGDADPQQQLAEMQKQLQAQIDTQSNSINDQQKLNDYQHYVESLVGTGGPWLAAQNPTSQGGNKVGGSGLTDKATAAGTTSTTDGGDAASKEDCEDAKDAGQTAPAAQSEPDLTGGKEPIDKRNRPKHRHHREKKVAEATRARTAQAAAHKHKDHQGKPAGGSSQGKDAQGGTGNDGNGKNGNGSNHDGSGDDGSNGVRSTTTWSSDSESASSWSSSSHHETVSSSSSSTSGKGNGSGSSGGSGTQGSGSGGSGASSGDGGDAGAHSDNPNIPSDVRPLVGQTMTGRGTFYSAGLGACGKTNSDQDMIVAVSKDVFERFNPSDGNPNHNHLCGLRIKITYKGKSAFATIEDECPTCPTTSLDMTKTLFEHFADPDQGVLNGMQWTILG
ncbi:uncharacterized protein PFL1_05137 [Pseudozyma flocculosa PF-1]|uniref:RlpA-like protein double-psi beta-barrel domain-containing protein n=2 Tax=Pseudozyma flocculosa TaxID=84751 RepID=A0A5C3F7A4_9BASI|nr:uncharacterized protein PFL1_05137 [Pseudozyma flocculosa PF-1]EPQ27214.1 hypothetical protein PFL1_05137 [Pseudozyma flocculosa PF-1]SPO39577.1 uncharacterized protein PSFLO_05058 [Pseudozyma flocculosa]